MEIFNKQQYQIKVPVYSTEISDESLNELFENNNSSVHTLVSYVKKKIDDFNSFEIPIEKHSLKKIKTKEVNSIKYFDYGTETEPLLLLQIVAFDKNLHDGVVRNKDTNIEFDENTRIGTPNNFVLLYPTVKGIEKDKLIKKFLVFVYQDPNKEHDDIVKIVKMVLDKIIGQPIVGIKPPQVLAELSKEKTPFLQMQFFQYAANGEDEFDMLLEYKTGDDKLKMISEKTYTNIPFEKLNQAIEYIRTNVKSKSKYALKVNKGRVEYNLEYFIDEAKQKLKETADKLFNFPIDITSEEFESKKIFEPDFIVNKLLPVVKNYNESYSE